MRHKTTKYDKIRYFILDIFKNGHFQKWTFSKYAKIYKIFTPLRPSAIII